MNRHHIAIAAFLAIPTLLAPASLPAQVEIYGNGNRGGSTVAGDELRGAADLAVGLGQGSLLRSMSAVQLQKALQERLKFRQENLEGYYNNKAFREAELKKKTAEGVANYKAATEHTTNKRLSKSQIHPATGELYWPKPLDAKELAPYRKPIEEALAKRGSPGETYDRFDYLRVSKMLTLISEAVDSIKDKLDPREVVALKEYLNQIDFDARFNAENERIDY
ncbi:hypothetical protein [Allorhodopirellula heiligendammensis]|uniref:Uncharacterized protein n=1 Tax=Allorhodopirellula heiligendammensis TaxID=2714739 RepID=A0A5C6BBG4_9BACT|nr:hypothetical protein [Allorhodopirellula heiligendammensis]TWU08596.1 hypothetical protein Poly21_55650 [Allorhodopirellula heiligendammensis]